MEGRLEIVIVMLTLVSLAFILELVRRRQLREKYALLWLAVGAVAVVLVLARPVLDRLSLFLGITYGPTTLFLFAILFLLAIVGHLSWEVSRLEGETRHLAEEIALLKARPPTNEPSEDDAPGRPHAAPER